MQTQSAAVPRLEPDSALTQRAERFRCGLRRHHPVARRPHPDVLFLDRRRHQAGEEVGRAGEGGDAELGEGGGVAGVIAGGSPEERRVPLLT